MELDERGLRRPDWVEGVGVPCADGQVWTMPAPRVVVRPAAGPLGPCLYPSYALAEGPDPSFHQTYRALRDEAVAALEALDLDALDPDEAEGFPWPDIYAAHVPMFAWFLRFNYYATPEQARWLFLDGFVEADDFPGAAGAHRALREGIIFKLHHDYQRACRLMPPLVDGRFLVPDN